MARFFHATSEVAAVAILRDGFRDADDGGRNGSVDADGNESTLSGVWLTDRDVVDENDGAHSSEALLEIQIDASEEELAQYELVVESLPTDPPLPAGLEPWRKWCVPAAILNARASVQRVERDS